MPKSGAATPQDIIVTEIVELDMVVIFVQPFLRIGDAVGPDDMGPNGSPFAWAGLVFAPTSTMLVSTSSLSAMTIGKSA